MEKTAGTAEADLDTECDLYRDLFIGNSVECITIIMSLLAIDYGMFFLMVLDGEQV